MILEETYPEFFERVKLTGKKVPSRYGDTVELLSEQFVFHAGALVNRPKINYALGWQEALQLVAGIYEKDWIERVAPAANMDLFTKDMAYGLRVGMQIHSYFAALVNDSDTRQAVMFIGHPRDGMSSSQPCTTSIQFIIRDLYLHMNISMRSWDLYRGLPYDIMMFGLLNLSLSRALGITPGKIAVTAGSAHVYTSDLENTPVECNTHFNFAKSAPDQWGLIVAWAENEARNLQRRGTPNGIIVE